MLNLMERNYKFTNFRELENPVPMEAISKVLSVLRMLWGGKYLNHEIINQLTV